MVRERMYDLQGTNGDLWVEGFRCPLCGNLVDAVILENRQRSIAAVGAITLTSPRMPRPLAAGNGEVAECFTAAVTRTEGRVPCESTM